MALWVGITVAAAFLQNLRSMLQKHLKARLSSLGATAIRFFFAMPVAWAIWASLGQAPALPTSFYGFTMLAAIGQIIGTLLLIYLFGLKNFAVGSSLARTEAVQTAMIGSVLLGDTISPWAVAGLLISLVGVILIAGKPAQIETRPVAIGLASGTSFAIASVLYRAATQVLESGGPVAHGAAVLVVATSFQSALLLAWFQLKESPVNNSQHIDPAQ